MKKRDSNKGAAQFAPLTAVALVIVTAVVVMMIMPRLRPIGAMPADERGSVKMYAMDVVAADEGNYYTNGYDYFIYDDGVRLATVRGAYDEAISIAQVTQDHVALVVDQSQIPLHQGNVLLVDRDNGAVQATGDHGLYWGVHNDEHLVFTNDATGTTSLDLLSFDSEGEESLELGKNYYVNQVEMSPDGSFIVVAVATQYGAYMSYGKLLSVHLENRTVTELSQLSTQTSEGPDLPFDDVIKSFTGNTLVNFALDSTTGTYELK